MRRVTAVAVALLVLLGLAAPAASGHGKPQPPKRVLIIVLDQFRPDLVDKFDMRNVRALMRDGAQREDAFDGGHSGAGDEDPCHAASVPLHRPPGIRGGPQTCAEDYARERIGRVDRRRDPCDG